MSIQRPLSKQPIPSHAQQVFTGKIFNVFQWNQQLYDGSQAIFEKIKRTDTVNVLPVTSEGKIILSKQEQPGINPFIGVIGGRVDVEEEPLTAVKRELLEETGMVSSEWILWDAVQLTEKIDWAIYTFVAKNCTRYQKPNPEAGEKITLIEVSFDELVELSAQPEFRDLEISLKLHQILHQPAELVRTKQLFGTT